MLRLRGCAAMLRCLLGALLLHGAAADINMVGAMPVVDTYHPANPQGAPAFYSMHNLCPSGTDGNDIPDSFDSDSGGEGIPDALSGTVSVDTPGPLCDSAGDGSSDEENLSRQRAPEPSSWAGISIFGFGAASLPSWPSWGWPSAAIRGAGVAGGASTTLPAAPLRYRL